MILECFSGVMVRFQHVHFVFVDFNVHVFFIYIFMSSDHVLFNFFGICKDANIHLLSSCQLVTNVFFKNWSKISQAFAGGMQFGNNWSLTSTQKTKDRTTRTPLKTRGEHRCSGRVSRFLCLIFLQIDGGMVTSIIKLCCIISHAM
jgi:hypothetical protein